MEELREKMTMTAHYALSIPELLPIVGFRKDQGILPLNEDHNQGLLGHAVIDKSTGDLKTGYLAI